MEDRTIGISFLRDIQVTKDRNYINGLKDNPYLYLMCFKELHYE